MKYRKNPVAIEAYTFDEMIEIGMSQIEANIVDGELWSFKMNGHAITHESKDEYIISTLEGEYKMTRGDMLIIGVRGEIYPCKIDIFNETYELIETKNDA